jgi:hypothetical protein
LKGGGDIENKKYNVRRRKLGRKAEVRESNVIDGDTWGGNVWGKNALRNIVGKISRWEKMVE